MTPLIELFVPGVPQQAGSKTAYPYKKKNGKMGVRVSDANPKAAHWKKVVAEAVIEYADKNEILSEPLDCPLSLTLKFTMPRPAGHYTKKKGGALTLKPKAPYWHTSKPDTTKLVRCVEDALNGIVWDDDSSVCVQTASKEYGDKFGVLIHVEVIP